MVVSVVRVPLPVAKPVLGVVVEGEICHRQGVVYRRGAGLIISKFLPVVGNRERERARRRADETICAVAVARTPWSATPIRLEKTTGSGFPPAR